MGSNAEPQIRWAEWLTDDGVISGTIGRLEVDRDRWARLRAGVEENAAIPHAEDTVGWFWFHYACDAAMRLRRLGDPDGRSASLGRLLAEIAENASHITRQGYLNGWRDAVDADLWELVHEPQANFFFDEFAGAGGEAVDPLLVEADRAQLKAALEPIKFFVDKRLAHHNPDHDPSLTYQEISSGIDEVGNLYRKYVRLVRRVDLPTGPPTDNTDWGTAFTVAWCPNGLPST